MPVGDVRSFLSPKKNDNFGLFTIETPLSACRELDLTFNQ